MSNYGTGLALSVRYKRTVVGVRHFSTRTTGPDTGAVALGRSPRSSSVLRKKSSVVEIMFEESLR
jgi:hypothetical protein